MNKTIKQDLTKFELLKELSQGCSIQSRTANQFWIVLAITSFITLISQPNTKGNLVLPFELGEISSSVFYILALILICFLSIAYVSALIQSSRTRNLIQKLIKGMSKKEVFIHKVHLQDFVDISISPTYLRVAPISEYLLGRNQFISTISRRKCSILNTISAIFYLILKSLVFIFTYIISIFAIYKSWKIHNDPSYNFDFKVPTWMLLILIIITVAVFVVYFIDNIRYTFNAAIKIYNQGKN